MTKVDFGAWSPTDRARDEIEKQAAKLPPGWMVTLSMNADASRSVSVLVEGKPTDFERHFDHGRFDLVATFLERLARHASGQAEG
jgi:hypothetical protein